METRSRIIGLDIIRAMAIVFVIAGHFFLLNTPFKEHNVTDLSMFVQGCALSLFMIGVPLFITLTGYLNTGKRWSAAYYKGLVPILLLYLFYCVITIIFRTYYLEDVSTATQWAMRVLDFSAVPYGWYIEMYIGLFFFIPFLNLTPQEHTKTILIILFFVTIFPHWINRNGLHLAPGFWKDMWPLAYYYLGRYIKENQPVLVAKYALPIALLVMMANPFLCLLFSSEKYTLFLGGPEDIASFVLTAIVFTKLYNSNRISTITIYIYAARHISINALDIYLCCYIFDALFYPFFKAEFYESQSQFGIWIFILVPLVLISSLIVAIARRKFIPFETIKNRLP